MKDYMQQWVAGSLIKESGNLAIRKRRIWEEKTDEKKCISYLLLWNKLLQNVVPKIRIIIISGFLWVKN